jgi:hypothetical protein
MPAMSDADWIIIGADEASLIEYPRKHGFWKVRGPCDIGIYPQEQHGISASSPLTVPLVTEQEQHL